jgi:hypothetical protein
VDKLVHKLLRYKVVHKPLQHKVVKQHPLRVAHKPHPLKVVVKLVEHLNLNFNKKEKILIFSFFLFWIINSIFFN